MHVSKIENLNLKVLKGYPNHENAEEILRKVFNLTKKIMIEKKIFSNSFEEFYPKNKRLLGLNINKGQRILIRLRSSTNLLVFLPICDLIYTFLHELSHNIYLSHNSNFHRFLRLLVNDFEKLQLERSIANSLVQNSFKNNSEHVLGSSNLNPNMCKLSRHEMRLKRLAAVQKRLGYPGSSVENPIHLSDDESNSDETTTSF